VLQAALGVRRAVQIILRLYASLAEVLLGFDVDCCCIGYDGSNVCALPRCLWALRHQVNVVNALHAWPNRASYVFLQWLFHRCAGCAQAWDQCRQIRRTPLEQLMGLGRLLSIAHQTASALLGMKQVSGGWDLVMDAGAQEGLKIPARLRGCWDSSRRSREYLNANDALTGVNMTQDTPAGPADVIVASGRDREEMHRFYGRRPKPAERFGNLFSAAPGPERGLFKEFKEFLICAVITS
jgi:hypothetical protein